MLGRSTTAEEGYAWAMSNTPFWPPHEITTSAAYRQWLRELYGRRPQLFLDAARNARDRSYYLLGQEWMTAVLFDALCRVARAHGMDIGEPLQWTE
jgi:hypothetical protein